MYKVFHIKSHAPQQPQIVYRVKKSYKKKAGGHFIISSPEKKAELFSSKFVQFVPS